MITRLFLIFILLSAAQVVNAQGGSIVWQKSFGGSGWDRSGSIVQTFDGGLAVVGNSTSTDGMVTGNHGAEDLWIIKLDSIGNLIWEKSLGGTQNECGIDIMESTYHDLVLLAYTYSNDFDVFGNHGDMDIWLIRLDKDGNIQWQKTYGGSDRDSPNSLISANDGGFIISGDTYSSDGDVTNNHGDADCWILKVDELGNIQWQKSLGGSERDDRPKIISIDGGYLMVGNSLSNDGDVSGNHSLYGCDIWLVELDEQGNIQWQKCYGGTSTDFAYSLIEDNNHDYVVAGYSWSDDGDITDHYGGFSNSDCWVLKLDSAGNIIWTKSLGGNMNQAATEIVQTKNDKYVLIASTEGIDDIWLMGLNNQGQLEEQDFFGGSLYDGASGIIEKDNNTLVLAGSTNSNDGDVTINYGGSDIWIVALNQFTNIEEIYPNEKFVVYPNPSRGLFNVLYPISVTTKKLEVFNALGERVFYSEDSLYNSNDLNKIDLSWCPLGVYLLHVESNAGIFSEKLMISK